MKDTDTETTGQKDSTAEDIVSIWSKAVDTQMHFNEMSVKSRQLGLTFVAAALGLAIFLFSRPASEAKYVFDIAIHGNTISFHVAVFIIIAAAASVYAVKLLDLGVYHMMLRGAVAFGEDLEEMHIKKILGLNKGMTQSISHFSRNSDAKATRESEFTPYRYLGNNQKNARDKINAFYWWVITALLIAAAALFGFGNSALIASLT